MRGSLIALVILAVIVGAVWGNAVYVCHATEALLAELDALPAVPNPGETPAAVAAVRENFERRSPLLGITVSHSVLDRVRESLVLLETQARTDAPADYASTLALLRELVREIARLEKLSATNIL